MSASPQGGLEREPSAHIRLLPQRFSLGLLGLDVLVRAPQGDEVKSGWPNGARHTDIELHVAENFDQRT